VLKVIALTENIFFSSTSTMASADEQYYNWADERNPSAYKDGATVINANEFFICYFIEV